MALIGTAQICTARPGHCMARIGLDSLRHGTGTERNGMAQDTGSCSPIGQSQFIMVELESFKLRTTREEV